MNQFFTALRCFIGSLCLVLLATQAHAGLIYTVSHSGPSFDLSGTIEVSSLGEFASAASFAANVIDYTITATHEGQTNEGEPYTWTHTWTPGDSAWGLAGKGSNVSFSVLEGSIQITSPQTPFNTTTGAPASPNELSPSVLFLLSTVSVAVYPCEPENIIYCGIQPNLRFVDDELYYFFARNALSNDYVARDFTLATAAEPPATATRTPWQQHEGLEVGPGNPYGIIAFSAACSDPFGHGYPCLYDFSAGIPLVDDPNWFNAPDADVIGFGDGGSSKLRGYACLRAVDFNYFQTLVNIPSGMQVSQFTIDFVGMDDGSRVSICNSEHPNCDVIDGSYVYLGKTGTTDLKDFVVPGETNRVVITQVDDCWSGNQLRSAVVTLNGEVITVFNLGIAQLTNQEETNSSHSVTASLSDQADQPVEGVEVSFEVVSGIHVGPIGVATTDANGVATTSYIGTNVGFDTIKAFVDDNGTIRESNPLVVEWIVPPNAPPVANCADVEANTLPGSCSVSTSIDAGSYDPDGDLFTTSQDPAGPYGLGATPVNLTVDDGELTDSCSAVVTVSDAERPDITCSAPVEKECTSPLGATAEFSATTTDNCGVANQSCDQTSGDTFALGTTPVSCSAIDVGGNAAQCSTSVTVVDTTPPSVNCNIPDGGISGSDLPLSMTATGADTCSSPSVSVAFLNCTKDKDGSTTGCSVSASGATLTISELGKGKSVNWSATAVDGEGHATTVSCSVSRGASNQGLGNGAEGSDPGNSNQGDPANSNDENGGTPGSPGKKKGK